MSTSSRLRIAFAAIAVTDLVLAGSTKPWAHRARRVTKPLLMPTLAGALAVDEQARTSPLRTTTLAGLASGWIGDIALLGHGPRSFMAGSAAFGVGHAAYSSGFLRHQDPSRALASRGAARAIAATWLASAPVIARAAWREDRGLGATVLTYSALLSSTVAAAQNLDPALSPRARRSLALGTGLFLASDSMLGSSTFLFKNPPARLESAVMATYTAAQYLIADGAARA